MDAAGQDRERLTALLDASGLLGQSLDHEATLARLPDILVPRFGDLCAIDVVEDDGAIRRLAVRHAEPAMAAVADRVKALGPPSPDAPMGVLQILRLGRVQFVPRLDDAALVAGARDAEHLALLRALDLRSAMILPLRARGRSIGILWIFRCGPREPFVAEDVPLMEEFAARTSLAVDNAWLYRQAQAAIEARDQFISVAVHEIRTPLTALGLRLHILQDARLSPERRQKAIAAAASEVARLDRLVEQVLDVARVDRAELHLAPVEMDLAALARDVAAAMAGESLRTGSALAVRAPAPVTGRWDPVRVEQVLANLLSNAFRYGLGRPIDLAVEAVGAVARVTVRDHGVGIAAHDHARIFRLFERSASVRHYGGLGIGLWIAGQIVAASGGAIRVESEAGGGATFTVELPRTSPPEPGHP